MFDQKRRRSADPQLCFDLANVGVADLIFKGVDNGVDVLTLALGVAGVVIIVVVVTFLVVVFKALVVGLGIIPVTTLSSCMVSTSVEAVE